MLLREKSLLLVVDVQGKLAEAMYQKEALFTGLHRLIKAAQVLAIPILWLEQMPEKLGPTVPAVAELLSPRRPLRKTTFSCLGSPEVCDALEKSGRDQILLAGIEVHICIYQTAVDLLRTGYEVEVVSDAVSSRTRENKEIGLAKARAVGVSVTSIETCLFELLKTAESPDFKAISQIVK